MNRSPSVCGAAIDRRGTRQAELSSLAFSYSSSSFIEISAAPPVTPNPSIERTCPGKPGHASHLKR